MMNLPSPPQKIQIEITALVFYLLLTETNKASKHDDLPIHI